MIQRSTLEFLAKLKKNNTKDWFDKNRKEYDSAKENYKEFLAELILNISKFDPAVKSLEPKDCMFRINRDIRFSNDKTPYKTNIGASIAPGGKKSDSAGYYIHIQPGASFLAGGVWHPEPPQLNAIRQEIDYNMDEFRKLTANKSFKKFFGALSVEDKIKTTPKGYDKDHPEIESLKLRSFIMECSLDDKTVLSKDLLKQCTDIFKAMYPMNVFLRRASD
jgi:uncharacterized protein (TIGR02453 family)